MKLTPAQFNTLQSIENGGGRTGLMTIHWRNRHYQALLRQKLLYLRTDPFKTKADFLYGAITPKGRVAATFAPDAVRKKAKALSERSYARYIARVKDGFE